MDPTEDINQELDDILLDDLIETKERQESDNSETSSFTPGVEVQEDERRKIVKEEMDRLAIALDVPGEVSDLGESFFTQYVDQTDITGNALEVLAAACLYAACKIKSIPLSPDDFVDVPDTVFDRVLLLRRVKTVSNSLGLDPEAFFDPTQYVTRYCSELGLSREAEDRALEILEGADDAEIGGGKSPTGRAAGAVYNASIDLDVKVTQSEIAEVAGVTVTTIRNNYQEQREVLYSLPDSTGSDDSKAHQRGEDIDSGADSTESYNSKGQQEGKATDTEAKSAGANSPKTTKLEYYCEELGFDGEAKHRALEILSVTKQSDVDLDQTRTGWAAGAVYNASLELDLNVTQSEIADIASVTESTISQRYRSQRKVLNSGVDSTESEASERGYLSALTDHLASVFNLIFSRVGSSKDPESRTIERSNVQRSTRDESQDLNEGTSCKNGTDNSTKGASEFDDTKTDFDRDNKESVSEKIELSLSNLPGVDDKLRSECEDVLDRARESRIISEIDTDDATLALVIIRQASEELGDPISHSQLKRTLDDVNGKIYRVKPIVEEKI